MENFFNHLKDTSPSFVCNNIDNKTEKTFSITHVAGEIPDKKSLEKLKSLAKNEYGELLKFYSVMNGGRFYINGETAGILISPIDELEKFNEEMRDWIFDEDEAYEFQKNGFAFGEIECSGNYFVIYKGKIFYADHDGGDDTPLSKNIVELFEKSHPILLNS